MNEFTSPDSILLYAIEREDEAAAFYDELAERAEWPWMRETFREFAREELGHKEKLLVLKHGHMLTLSAHAVQDMKMADYMVDVPPDPKLDYRQALTLAMKKELASMRLYNNIAARMTDQNLRIAFQALAQEELRHKVRFESEYDHEMLKEN